MSYLVLARKWRPQLFADVVGQDHVVHTIHNALAKQRLAHAFVFTGARGVGKTTLARLLAKAMQCEKGPATDPCGECQTCKDIADSRCVDVLEIDGASNRGIDQVRELRDGVRYLPQHARYKIVIIDEVHMLTTEAFNALLKTLEEPPPHAKFIFATTEPHRIPVTILSRCQRFDFKRIALPQIVAHLQKLATAENIDVEEDAVHQIARAAQGSMRDALSLLDQAIAYADTTVTAQVAAEALGIIDRRLVVELCEAILQHDAGTALDSVAHAYKAGFDLRQLLGELVEEFRHLIVANVVDRPETLIDLPERDIAALSERAKTCAPEDLQRLFATALDHTDAVARADSPRLVLDVLVARLASMPPYRSLEELSAIIDKLGLQTQANRGPVRSSTSPSSSSTAPRKSPAAPTSSVSKARVSSAAPVANKSHALPQQDDPPPKSPAVVDQPKAETKTVAEVAPTSSATKPTGTASASSSETSRTTERKESKPVSIPGVDTRWQEAVLSLREEHPRLASFLEHGIVSDVSGEKLTLRFEQAFYADAIRERREDLESVTKAVRVCYPGVQQVLVEVGEIADSQRLSIAEATAQQVHQNKATREAEALASPTVKQAIEIFGGTVLKVNQA